MDEEKIIEQMRNCLGAKLLDASCPAQRRIFVKVNGADVTAAARCIRETVGITHVSTISGVDTVKAFELLYHFADNRVCLTLRAIISRSEPEIETVTDFFPGAILYEREIQDMLGIRIKNIPDPRPLVLPDDWPADNYPLRKDWVCTRPEKKIPGGKK